VRLLLDQNLSPHLVDALQDLHPGSAHVRDVGLASADDEAVWTFAAQQGLSIVSKDSDFRQRSFVRGHPPKVVWIARGNPGSVTGREIIAGSGSAGREADLTEDRAGAFSGSQGRFR